MIPQILTTAALLAAPAAGTADTVDLAPVAHPVGATVAAAPADTTRPRRHAVETSEWYARRLLTSSSIPLL